jgi:hypothetical protein
VRIRAATLRTLVWTHLPVPEWLRLSVENDQLRRECALLREEIRIKDAAWARMPKKHKKAAEESRRPKSHR